VPATISENRNDSTLSPYPGLRYYQPNQNEFFSAREEHVKECYRQYTKGRILILHGTTGCGKSSFLRAGLKPYVEELNGRQTFPEDDRGEFQLVRSGPDPLKELTQQVFRDIKRCADSFIEDPEREMHGGPIADGIVNILAPYPSMEAFEAAVRDDKQRLINAITSFEAVIQEPPALVIDQAEEVFTLNIMHEDGKRELTASELDAKINPYFDFLTKFAREPLTTKVVISLRTEYKGMFDDRLESNQLRHGDRPTIYGFHLPDLDAKGMEDAIKRPAEKSSLIAFEPGVPKLIVEKLQELPPGGRLPVLQVACLRLWLRSRSEQVLGTKMRGAGGAAAPSVKPINELDVSLLGPFNMQLTEYVRDRLREMVEQYQPFYASLPDLADGALDVGGRADKWMGFFREQLVDLQADGRATTRKLSDQEMRKALEKKFGADFAGLTDAQQTPEQVVEGSSARSELDWLARDSIGILRKQVDEKSTSWMLGHDSIGLVLERWNQVYGASMRSMMMDMTMPLEDEGSERRYFPEPLAVTKIYVPHDLLWDRYLIQFAEEKGFTTRLGLEFEVHDALRALSGNETTGMGWSELAANLQNVRKTAGHPVLFICERNNIPESDVKDWTDVAIADEFTGNALIGPRPPKGRGFQPLRDLGYAEDKQRREDMTQQLKALFEYLVDTKSEIICYDRSAHEALQLAGRLGGVSPEILERLNVDVDMSWQLPYSARDFLFQYMWDRNEEAQKSGSGAHTFIMGSDCGRAVAQYAGFVTYFSRQDLLWLRKMQLVHKIETLSHDTFGYDPHIVTHAVWNLGFPPGAKPSRELKLRLASLAFFVAEYVRTNADEFVRFVYDRQEDLRRNNDGFRISQDAVREVIKDCFNFYHFEHYGRLFYQHDSPQRYWVEEDDQRFAAGNSRPIYFEMQSLRAQCLADFNEFEMALKLEDATSAAILPAVERSRCAWNNYNIHNFYDAQLQIAQANELLRQARK
jgi:hypothetical protein